MSKDNNLSEEFKKDLKENKKTNYLGIVLALIAIILIFGTVGVAVYQLSSNNNDDNNKTAEEKIESKPQEVTPPAEVNIPTTTQPAPTPVPTTTPATETYTVVDGDNLGSIAAKFSTTVDKLVRDNTITDETALQIGQVLKIIK